MYCRYAFRVAVDINNSLAAVENLRANRFQRVTQRNGFQVAATIKDILSDSCDAISYRHRGQTAAIPESTLSNACDAIWYRHRCQTATLESTTSNACDAIGNSHGGQTAAIFESLISNACDAIGNGHRSQTAAIIESMISYACDAIVFTTIGYGSRDIGCGDIPSFIIGIISITLIRHLSGFVGRVEGVIQVANLCSIGEHRSYACCERKD